MGESWTREQLYDAVDLGSYDGSSMETERVICTYRYYLYIVYVRMYICMHICMYVYIYVYGCIYVYICMY